MTKTIDLIGDGIENPWNARTLIDVAYMFGSNCFFRDRKGLRESFLLTAETDPTPHILKLTEPQLVKDKYSPVLALENLENATDLFGFNYRSDVPSALIVGNEKFGVSHEMHNTANHVLQIPMTGPTVNTLNVATAAGVALYYLNQGPTARMLIRSHPEKYRPEVLLIGGGDHIELGSAIRSAGAFGWERIFLEDRQNIWFGCDRVTRSEGRGAARRGRNAIRLFPAAKESRYAFKKVVLISKDQGIPLSKAKLAEGPQQLIIIPDESSIDPSKEDWERSGAKVQYVKIDVPSTEFVYHYRLFASIALAEIARQVGQSSAERFARRVKQGPVFDKFLSYALHGAYEELDLNDLVAY